MPGRYAYSPLDYWSVAVYPRTHVREPYPRRRRPTLIVPAVVAGAPLTRFVKAMADVVASGPRYAGGLESGPRYAANVTTGPTRSGGADTWP